MASGARVRAFESWCARFATHGEPVTEATWNIPLPEGAEPPVEVFVNSVRRPEADYTVEGRWVRLRFPVRPKQSLGLGRRLLLSFGVGVYGDLAADQVDVGYRLDGEVTFESDVTVIPSAAAADESPQSDSVTANGSPNPGARQRG